jgi:hypothetical protein
MDRAGDVLNVRLQFPESASVFNLELGFGFNSGLGFAISTLVWPLSLSFSACFNCRPGFCCLCSGLSLNYTCGCGDPASVPVLVSVTVAILTSALACNVMLRCRSQFQYRKMKNKSKHKRYQKSQDKHTTTLKPKRGWETKAERTNNRASNLAQLRLNASVQ